MQAKQHLPVSDVSENSQNTLNPSLELENSTNQVDAGALSAAQNAKGSNAPSINDYSQEQALDMVDKMPDYVLGQYVDKFMAKGASDVISDKRRFAERAVEELYKSNDSQPLVGNVKLSLSQVMPSISLDTSKVNKNDTLFAHLDTDGKVPASAFVFVKWVNNQTGQVLLFEKKNIVANSNQNWVSFKPYDGWVPGSYDIRFYQFTSELQPVAQLTYQIFNVEGSDQDGGGNAANSIVSATASN